MLIPFYFISTIFNLNKKSTTKVMDFFECSKMFTAKGA